MATDHPDDDCDSLFVVCTISDPPAADAVAGGAALALPPPARPSPPRRRRGLRCRFSRRRSPALQFAGHGACRPRPTHRGGLDPRAADEQHPFLAFRGWGGGYTRNGWLSNTFGGGAGRSRTRTALSRRPDELGPQFLRRVGPAMYLLCGLRPSEDAAGKV